MEYTDVNGDETWDFSTAFFVAPTLLLTAGHAALAPKDARLYLFPPGTPELDFNAIISKSPVIRPTVLDNDFKVKRDRTKDIAILSSGSYECRNYLPLSRRYPSRLHRRCCRLSRR